MNTKLIYTTVTDASLYIDDMTIQEIQKFISNFIGASWLSNPKLCIFLTTAIVCECKKLPAMQQGLNVPFGLTVETIMKLCAETSKEEFISCIINLSEKWPTCPPQFLHKLSNLKFNLRIFNKYRSVCKFLGEKLEIDQECNGLIGTLFWLIYLLAKAVFSETDSLEVITQIVPFLLSQIYTFYLRMPHREAINQSISASFGLYSPPTESQIKLHERYRKEFLNILNECYSKRYHSEMASFDFLLDKPFILERLIDDLSNIYLKVIENSPQFSVNEMSFLDIRRDMTPESFHENIESNDGAKISQKIYFDKQKSMEQESESLCISKQDARRIKSLEETPLSQKMQNMSWIRSCNGIVDESKLQLVQCLYQKFNQNGVYSIFYEKVMSILETLITEFSPTCKDVGKRKKEIYKFFTYIIDFATLMYRDKMNKIFLSDSLLMPILCLSAEIFNFVYQTYCGLYSRYCEIFSVDYIYAFWPINWFGHYIKMPKAVQEHLYSLQRRFLLKEIWQTDLGYKIITNHQQVIRINQLHMIQRLKHHIRQRLQEICREAQVGDRMVSKIYNLVLQVVEWKPYLLQKNNIDQILICCIGVWFRINLEDYKLPIQKIFQYYQRVSLTSSDNKDKLYDADQNQLNIVEYYNQVFLEEMEDMIKNSQEKGGFLLTPQRLKMAQKSELGIEMTPFKLKYYEKETGFLKKIETGFVHTGGYQLNLAKNIKMESGAMEEEMPGIRMKLEKQLQCSQKKSVEIVEKSEEKLQVKLEEDNGMEAQKE